MTCPVCGKREEGVVLVCLLCWGQVPPRDRAQFRSMFRRHPKRPECWGSKAEKIVRELKGKRAAAAARP